MRFILFSFGLLLSFPDYSQSLSSQNFNYWYDPTTELEFNIMPVQSGKQVKVYYQLISNRQEYPVDTYSISWENRPNLTGRSGQPVASKDSVLSKSSNTLTAFFPVTASTTIWYIVAKVTNQTTQGIFYFYKPVDPLWPVNKLITVDGASSLKRYFPSASNLSIDNSSDKKAYGFFYKTIFPPALPSFADTERTDPFLKSDSVFVVDQSFATKSIGLYLLQEDTSLAQGVSFLVTDKSYPKFTRVASLVDPLVYITTNDEYKQLTAAKGDKAAFDKVILEITRDKERAKDLMRSYFQRVEKANKYFTEYKEGWKTDRGMIYIIYGKPDEVSRTTDNEIWYYRNQKTKFVFNKSGSVFCPENYKLQRDKQYMQEWYSLVDMWRKSRF